MRRPVSMRHPVCDFGCFTGAVMSGFCFKTHLVKYVPYGLRSGVFQLSCSCLASL